MMDLATAATQHSPRRWFERGVYPECSCGLAPRDNGVLTEHWATYGISWYDAHGRLQWKAVLPSPPSLATPEQVENWLAAT